MKGLIWRVLALLIIGSLVSIDVASKTLRGYTQNVEIEGLDYAYKAVQDKQGYIWFANNNGLHRYDGKQLTSFGQDSNNGLSNHNVRSLHIDSNQTLWIGTIKGLHSYNTETQRFTHIFDDKWPESKNLNITAIISDQHDQLLITTIGHDLVRYNIQTNTFTKLPLLTAKRLTTELLTNESKLTTDKANQPWHVQQDASGDIWLSSQNGLYQLTYDSDMQTLLKRQLFTTENSELDSNFIILTYTDKQQNVWIGTTKGLHYYHRQTGRLSAAKVLKNTYNPLANTGISNFRTDKQGNLWISTWGNGVHILKPKQQQIIADSHGFNQQLTLTFDSFVHGESSEDDIQTNQIFFLLPDNHGMMWIIGSGDIKKVLTSNLAVNHINFIDTFNKNSSPKPQQVERANISLPNHALSKLFKDSQGYMWFGSLNGLARYHEINQTLQFFYHEKGNNQSLPANQITTVFEDNQQQIWIGTHLGLARFNPSTYDFTRLPFYPTDYDALNATLTDNILKYGVTDIIQDRDGTIWLATGNSLRKYHQKTGDFDVFSLSQSNFEASDSDAISVLGYNGGDVIWVGKRHLGLGQFDITTNTMTYFDKSPDLPQQTIYDFIIENANKVWIASTQGLTLFSGNNTFKRLKEQSTNSITVRTIQKDHSGILWLGTDAGLKSLNPETFQYSHYNQHHGLQQSASSIIRTSFLNDDGSLYFAGHGVNHFLPKDLTFTPPKLNVILTDFLLINRPTSIKGKEVIKSKEGIKSTEGNATNDFTLSKAIHFLDSITLNHQQNIFSIEFNALNYITPEQTHYQYRLKGFNDIWIVTDNNNRRATYTNIPAGDYQFEVKATTGDNPWSDIKKLNVSILPPWWQTTLAYFIYVFATLSLLWALYRWRTKSIIATSVALEKQVAERTKTISQLMAQKDQMFANFSHEFRTPLTLILHPADKLITNTFNDKKQITKAATGIKHNAQRLLRMVEQLLEFAKAESNHQQLGLQHYSLKQVLNYLIACFDSLFTSKNLQVTINDYQDAVLSLKPDSLETILNNLISNAIKYTPHGGRIDIAIDTQSQRGSGQVIINIKDNGIGIAPEHQSKIFERFGRVEQPQSEIFEGIHVNSQASTGIGLALVKELVNANGGQIQLTSAVNQGSCFTITLPKAEQTTSVNTANINEISNNSKQITALEISNLTNITTAPKTPLTDLNDENDADSCYNTNDNNKPLVLVIDDNHELLELIQSIISPHFNCLLTPNGKQGIKKAQEHLPDLVISDLMMPDISGFDVLKTLKSDELTAHIPVVMLTAKGDAQSRIEGWNNQADEYLAKPFNDQELIARISNILAIRKIISGRYQQQFAQNPQTANQENKLDIVAQQFGQKLEGILAKHYQSEQLNVAILAREMAMSQRQLIRKTKSILDMTPIESIRTYRLQKATEHLNQGMAPSAIAYEVGFASHSYFAACFKAKFGCTPSDYTNRNLSA